MTARPFRFAVQAHRAADESDPMTAAQWRETARSAQDLGFATLFTADHYIDRGRAPQELAPIAAMATAAAVTETLRVGCRVFCVDYHVPAALAKEAATLDLLSDGRLEFGIGAGWSPDEYASMGLEFAPAGARVSKLEEVIALMKAHWSGEEMDLHGEFVNVSGYAGLPVPIQRPRPPIMVGGGRRRVLSIAAREADIVSFSNVPFLAVDDAGLTPHEVALQRLDIVREAAGERFIGLELETSPYFTEITDRVDEAVARIAAQLGADPELVASHPNVCIGSADAVIDLMQQRREVYGQSYVTVPLSVMEDFAPIASRLVGA